MEEITRDDLSDQATRSTLRHLSESSTDPLVREMCREVLAGNISLGQAMMSSVYGGVFDDMTRPMAEEPGYLDQLIEDTREEAEAFRQRAEDQGFVLRDWN